MLYEIQFGKHVPSGDPAAICPICEFVVIAGMRGWVYQGMVEHMNEAHEGSVLSMDQGKQVGRA